jgi:hypothetical protein
MLRSTPPGAAWHGPAGGRGTGSIGATRIAGQLLGGDSYRGGENPASPESVPIHRVSGGLEVETNLASKRVMRAGGDHGGAG